MFLVSRRYFEGKKDNALVIDCSINGFRMKMTHPMDKPYSLISFRMFGCIKNSYSRYKNMQ